MKIHINIVLDHDGTATITTSRILSAGDELVLSYPETAPPPNAKHIAKRLFNLKQAAVIVGDLLKEIQVEVERVNAAASDSKTGSKPAPKNYWEGLWRQFLDAVQHGKVNPTDGGYFGHPMHGSIECNFETWGDAIDFAESRIKACQDNPSAWGATV